MATKTVTNKHKTLKEEAARLMRKGGTNTDDLVARLQDAQWPASFQPVLREDAIAAIEEVALELASYDSDAARKLEMREKEAEAAYDAYLAAGQRYLDALNATDQELADAREMMTDCWTDDPQGLIDEGLNDPTRIAQQVVLTREDAV